MIQQICTRLEQDGADPGLGVQVLSAYNEAYNNLAQHAYAPERKGTIDLLMEVTPTRLALVFKDSGESFDFDAVDAPDLRALPESGLGIFIMRAFMNEIRYEPKIDGRTNVLRMTKYLHAQTHPVPVDLVQGTFDDA